ncbi:hypothetical protein Tco_1394454 [Tanacetum coccineum]
MIHPQSSPAPAVSLHSSADPLQFDSGLVLPYFLPTDDPLESSINFSHSIEAGIQLSKEQLAILADTGDIVDSSPCAYIMTNNAIFQSDGIDSFDSDYDEVSTAQATFMDCEQQAFIDDSNNEFTSKSNMISYEQYLKENKSQVVHSTPSPANQDSMIMSVIEQMSNQERIKTFKQRPNVDLSSREKLINSQMDDMIRDILALKQEIDSLKQTLSNQIKEKESLLQTFNVFKIESKEKESKYKDKEIDLEKKINELDNISEHPNDTQTSVRVEVPKELPKVSLVITSVIRLKNHLASFDKAVKVRTTPDAITARSWGFEHTKKVFDDEFIPFKNSLQTLVKDFENGLLNELNEVITIFNQIKAVVDQCSVDKKLFEIEKKELKHENERLLEHIICQDVVNIVMHADVKSVNVLHV